MGPCRPGDAEHVGEVGVTRSRRQQVVGPHDLFDTLGVVIDDHDKVVGGGAVAAPEHDIVDDLGFDTADERFFSHRVRSDGGRQVTAARLVTA